jgi:hypothetical protein
VSNQKENNGLFFPKAFAIDYGLWHIIFFIKGRDKRGTLNPMTNQNDIVLIYLENTPLSFARIESILPDSKPNWYHVKLLMLQVPLHVVTWILRDVYINGEMFTMNGKQMRLEQVVCPAEPELPVAENKKEKKTESRKKLSPGKADVIRFSALKKKSS